MAIRKNTNPRMMDLQPEMQDILRRNGMQAHVVSDDTGYRLVVQGHDSPLLTYDLTERQMLALTDWGTNSANKKAYNVLTSIVGKTFICPRTSSIPVTPTAVSLWDCTATVSVWANTDVWDGWVCRLRSSAGRHATSGVSICGGSADNYSIRDHPLSLNGGTGE